MNAKSYFAAISAADLNTVDGRRQAADIARQFGEVATSQTLEISTSAYLDSRGRLCVAVQGEWSTRWVGEE